MTFMLRDRPDGQVEIIINRPVLVGIFPERDVAARVCAFLQEDAVEWPDTDPANFGRAARDVAEVEFEDVDMTDGGEAALRALLESSRDSTVVSIQPRSVAEKRPVKKVVKQAGLPVVVPEVPRQAAQLTVTPPAKLTPDEIDRAFSRIAEGEKIAEVAPSFGLTFFQLRGLWAAHKQKLQRHLAEGGTEACSHCSKPFTPSLTNLTTCARCSRD